MIEGLNQSGNTSWIDGAHKHNAAFTMVEYGAIGAPVSVNTSEFRPTENKVLVLPDPVEEVTKGGIIKPTASVTSEEWATTTGRIVAVSPLAFNYASPEEWEASGGAPPKAGQRIIYAKYAGLRVKSKRDGNDYVVLNDKDVCMTIED